MFGWLKRKCKKFLSPDEIADDLFEKMKDADGWVTFVKAGDEDDLAMYHSGLGRSIRNEYLLWDKENPHTMKGYAPELRLDIDYNPKHPDNLSGEILQKLYEKVKAYHANP